MRDDTSNGMVKIVRYQRWNVIITSTSAVGSASGGLTDCFNVRRGYWAKFVRKNSKVESGGQALQILTQKPFAIRRAGKRDLNLFRKSSTPENRWIDPIKMIGRTD